jgi:hypothetical protein
VWRQLLSALPCPAFAGPRGAVGGATVPSNLVFSLPLRPGPLPFPRGDEVMVAIVPAGHLDNKQAIALPSFFACLDARLLFALPVFVHI